MCSLVRDIWNTEWKQQVRSQQNRTILNSPAYSKYEGCLKSSWSHHHITLSRNFVEVRWRPLFRSTSLGKRCTSYNAPPSSRKHVADHWSLRNFLPRSSLFMVGKAHKLHGTRSELNSVFGWGKVDRWNTIRTSDIQSRSRPMRFLGFSNHEKGAPSQEISKWSTVCSTFSRSGWSVVRSASLAKGSTSKKRPHCTSTKFRLGVIRWVHEPFERPSYILILSFHLHQVHLLLFSVNFTYRDS
jgi:hypothetical protein